VAEDFDLGVLAGGDIYEWAATQVAADVAAARQRLKQEYPHYFTEEFE